MFEFIFQALWNFIGTLLLVCVIFEGTKELILTIKRK